MIDKNVDFALFGKCYLSYIYGASVAAKGKNVLLVDDERFSYGESFSQHLSIYDIKLLKRWGQELGSKTLDNLDKYLILNPYYVLIGKRRVRLGDTISRNIREFARKLPRCMETIQNGVDTDLNIKIFSCNSNEEIEAHFDQYCDSLADRFFSQGKSESLAMFIDNAPSFIRDIYSSMRKHVDVDADGSEVIWEMKTLIHVLRGIFQKRFSFLVSDTELIHLIVSFLSPSYKLNYDALTSDLKKEFEAFGGSEKKVRLEEWHFHKGKPWSLLLSSFEGVVLPKRVAVIGGDMSGLPLAIDSNACKFRGVKVKWSVSPEFAERVYENKVIGCSPSHLGDKMPVWEMERIANELTFMVYTSISPGTKIEFIEDRIFSYLEEQVRPIFVFDESDILTKTATFVSDLVLQERDITSKRGHKRPQILDTTELQNSVPVKGVYYHGQLNEGCCGLSSLIMDMKQASQKL